MRTHPNDCSFKPCLEQLETREAPAALISAYQSIQSQLLPVVQNLNTDLNSAISNFQTDYGNLKSALTAPSTTSSGGIAVDLALTTADWQRVLSDQSAINNTVNADINHFNNVALAFAFQSGNFNIYLITLQFVDPQFKNIENTANNTVNGQQSNANTPIPVTSTNGISLFGQGATITISGADSPPRS
jgi:hypothetical protein